jgi:uncharacterized Zn-binding protein involved in type VI secretion
MMKTLKLAIMGRPAAHVGALHICPLVTGIVPHVGGPVLPPGHPTVLVMGLPIACQFDMCFCVGPPDSIAMGSLGVFVNGLPVARVLDPTIHGGRISVVLPSMVMIGDINTAAAAAIWPGQQNFGNCGIQSANQLIEQATGVQNSEQAILDQTVAAGLTNVDPLDASNTGGTSAEERRQILANNGVPSTTIMNPTQQDISNAILDRRGIIINADAGKLWNGDPNIPNPAAYNGGGHAVTITDGDYDSNGNLTHVIINDTGTGTQGRRVPIGQIMDANQARGTNAAINVTDTPIWTQIRP